MSNLPAHSSEAPSRPPLGHSTNQPLNHTSNPAQISPQTQRLYFLDWVRIAAFALLVAYHVGMLYVSWDFHIKSPFASSALEPWMMLSSPWRMGLLFLVSGAATSLMLLRTPASGPWLRQRSRRLLLPLLLGVALVVPPQSYFEVVQKHAYLGSYVDFLKLYFSAYQGFCTGDKCLILPTWNHLWFVAYLWLYTALLWLALRTWPRALDWLSTAVARALAGPGLWLTPVGLLALARIALLTRFGSTHALVDDWYNHAVYLLLFALGAGLARQVSVFDRMAAARWPALAVAGVCWLLMVTYLTNYAGQASAPDVLRNLMRCVYATLQWTAMLAVLGFARRWLNRDHPWRAPLTEAVFPVYILHQTLIIALAVAMRPWHLAPAFEGPLLVALTLAGCLGAWWLLRHFEPLRPWLGMVRRPGAAALRSERACAPARPEVYKSG